MSDEQSRRLVPDFNVLGEKCYHPRDEILPGLFLDSEGNEHVYSEDYTRVHSTECNVPQSIITYLPPCSWDE